MSSRGERYHPAIDVGKGGGRIRDRADPDIFALEGSSRNRRPCHCVPGFGPV
jgi:hypothetical protein